MQHQLPVGTQTAARLRLDQHLSGLGCGVDGDEVRVCQPRGKIEQQLNRPVRDSDPGEMSFKVPPGAAPAVAVADLARWPYLTPFDRRLWTEHKAGVRADVGYVVETRKQQLSSTTLAVEALPSSAALKAPVVKR